MDKKIADILKEKLSGGAIAKVVFSGGRGECGKIVIKPIVIKGQVCYQFERFVGSQVFHSNLYAGETIELLCGDNSFADNSCGEKGCGDSKCGEFDAFRQINIFAEDEAITALISKKGKINIKVDKSSKTQVRASSHNREKNYLFSEGTDIEPLRDMGIFTVDNKIVKSKMDKFKQINRFIEIIDDEYKNIKSDKITILDFGCGKSYLTFLVYHYFSVIKNMAVNVIGYDLKADVVAHCNTVAKKYGYTGMKFIVADVANESLVNYDVDAIITLHACDTATDYALFNAIKHNVKNIFSVPCCQHEINAQIKNEAEMGIILRDGLIKERFSALLTDSVRAEILRQFGYKVDILEFVDFAHSPKNLMIRASKTQNVTKDFTAVGNLLQSFSTKQTLFKLVKTL